MNDALYTAEVDGLAERVTAGAKVAIGKNQNGVPCELVRALTRRKVRQLHVVGVPTGGYAIDLLIGAGCVAAVESSAITLDESGSAPRFINAVKSGAIKIMDSTCPAVYAGLSAAEKGVPFMPIRGLVGSDIVAHRDDYHVIANPFAEQDPIVLVPAIQPDFALVHAPMADDEGNVYVGTDKDAELMAHAAKTTLVTIEERYAGNLLKEPQLRAATLSSIYVGGIAVAPQGAWPMGQEGYYPEDLSHVAEYRIRAQTSAGFADYAEQYVFNRAAPTSA